ncbi:MAG: 2'-5' RNA ligase family protein [Deltaproteobacteria bacterium]|nr:2'-5' RNA ligase family protein [Deltaproteobacteria bacterium]
MVGEDGAPGGAVDFDATFQAFRARSHTLGPSDGALEEWRRGRSRFAVWVLRILEHAVVERMARVATALGDAIVPVPAHDAHVTAFVAGFPCAGEPRHDDDVPWRVLGEQGVALRAALAAPIELHVGGANACASCAFLDVHDASGALAAARHALARIHPEVRFAPYVPHVTVGRFQDTRAAAPLAAVLARLRDERPITLTIGALELVTFDATDEGHPTLVTERVVKLGGAEGVAAPRRVVAT